jgi:hypothetical protein
MFPVLAGESLPQAKAGGPPSTSLPIAARKDVDGRPSPTKTTRWRPSVTLKANCYFSTCRKRKLPTRCGNSHRDTAQSTRPNTRGYVTAPRVAAVSARTGLPQIETDGERVVASDPPTTACSRKTVPSRALGAGAVGALALGALAIGALAVGRMAIGRIAIGRGTIGQLHIRRLTVDELKVGRLVRD